MYIFYLIRRTTWLHGKSNCRYLILFYLICESDSYWLASVEMRLIGPNTNRERVGGRAREWEVGDEERMMLLFTKHHPRVFESLVCVIEVQCVSIYKVPAQWGGLITGSSCRLTRPLTGRGVKIRASAGERFQLRSSTAHTHESYLIPVYMGCYFPF